MLRYGERASIEPQVGKPSALFGGPICGSDADDPGTDGKRMISGNFTASLIS